MVRVHIIDDPEAWTRVVKTIREHLSGLARHIDIRMIMLQNSHMTLEEVLSLLPSIDHLPSALENALSADEVGAQKSNETHHDGS